MDPQKMSDADLEAYLRQRAYDDFNAELVVDHSPGRRWSARCVVYDVEGSGMGEVNLFSREGSTTRRAVLEALARSFEERDARGGPR